MVSDIDAKEEPTEHERRVTIASNRNKFGIRSVGQNQEGKASPGESPIPETMKYALSALNFIDNRCIWIDDR